MTTEAVAERQLKASTRVECQHGHVLSPVTEAPSEASGPSGAAGRAAGTPKKVALVACMRKLLTILNAMTHTTWQQIGQSENARP